jgi:hypothetical protein
MADQNTLPQDRSLTRPFLVRGSLNHPLVVIPTSIGALGVVALLLISLDRPRPQALSCFVPVLGAFLLALGVALWRFQQRAYIEVTPHGFRLQDRRGVRQLRDEDVLGLSRARQTDRDKASYFHVQLQIRGEPHRLVCKYSAPSGEIDPLGRFWDRLTAGLAKRTQETFASGGKLIGTNWILDQAGLHVGSEDPIPIERICKVGHYEYQICLWKDLDERAFFRTSSAGFNAQPLAKLIYDAIMARNVPCPTLPSHPLGRILMQRSEGQRMTLHWLLLTGLCVGWAVWRVFSQTNGEVALPLLVALACILILWGVVLLVLSPWGTIVFHELGLSQPWGARTKLLRYDQIEQITISSDGGMLIEPKKDRDLPIIRFRSINLLWDHGLADMQSQICGQLAREWGKRVPDGPVTWTNRLRFLPMGLEYRSWTLFTREEPVTVPYHMTRWEIKEGHFWLYVKHEAKAVLKVKLETPNLRVGLELLNQIYDAFEEQLLLAQEPLERALPMKMMQSTAYMVSRDPRSRLSSGPSPSPSPSSSYDEDE